MARLFSQRSVSRIAGRRPSRAEPDDPIFLPSSLFPFFSPLDSLPSLPAFSSLSQQQKNTNTINQQSINRQTNRYKKQRQQQINNHKYKGHLQAGRHVMTKTTILALSDHPPATGHGPL